MSESSKSSVRPLPGLIVAIAILTGGATVQADDFASSKPPAEDPRPDRVYRSPLLGRLWARAEYLVWATEGQYLPPLVTTSPPETPPDDAGVLGQAGTSVLFGDDRVNNDMISGGRFTLGFWRDFGQTSGVQVTYFGLVDQNVGYYSSEQDETIIARPFLDITNGQPDRELVAYPGLLDGQIVSDEVVS